jgi:arylsulfatase A-like enzyme
MKWALFFLTACSTGNSPELPPDPGPRPPALRSTVKIPGELQLTGEKSESPRSILLISWDTVRGDSAGLDQNPGIRALQDQGRSYTKAMTHFPETGISHWSLLTGVEPEIHGNVPGTGGSRYRGPTLAEIAKHEGYSTAAFIGGITLTDQATGLGRGFDVYDDRWDWMRKDVRPGKEIARAAAGWMKKQETPFFAFVHLFEAHHPYEPKPPHDALAVAEGPRPQQVERQFAKYKGEIQFLDSLLPGLMDAAGEDCVIVLTSDHGESFEHNYLYNHRESLWDSTMHIPLVIRGPGIEAGSRSDQLVALTDVLPTILELAGLPQEQKIQGHSLLSESPRERVDALTDPWFGENHSFAVRTRRYKVLWPAEGRVVAFDLQADPREERPLKRVPEDLIGARDAYRARLSQAASLQREALPSRMLPSEEVERLRALGYLGESQEPPR